MLRVVPGKQPSGYPQDPDVRAVEGWIFGREEAAAKPVDLDSFVQSVANFARSVLLEKMSMNVA